MASSPNALSAHIAKGSAIILDGALATYLETLGADISGALWSASILLDQPSLIKQTHLDYYRAGANVAITASYQASVAGLVKHLSLSEEEAKQVVRKSVELAQQARDEYVTETDEEVRKKLFIAGSVGPYGAFLADGSEYRGDYSIPQQEMKDFHRGRIQALVSAGVDVLACETIPSKGETEALLDLLTTEFPSTEAWFGFTLRDSSHVSDGTPLSEIAALFDDVEQVVALGFNCVPDDLALAALKNFEAVGEERDFARVPQLWRAVECSGEDVGRQENRRVHIGGEDEGVVRGWGWFDRRVLQNYTGGHWCYEQGT